MTRLRFASATDIGQVRSLNEDSVTTTGAVGAVADGMGGHSGGEVASKLALETFMSAVSEPGPDTMVDAARAANAAVLAKARATEDLAGMGTTLCAVGATDTGDGRVTLMNVGDSRVYLRSGDEFVQLTDDHSFVESLVRDGRISPEQAAVHPQRNVLTRALGIDDDLEVDNWELAVHNGDRFVLCSDGLFNEVSDAVINETVSSIDDPQLAARKLIELANEGGGHDNISVVIADVSDAPDTTWTPVAARLNRMTPTPTTERTAPAPPAADVPARTTRRNTRGFSWRTPLFVAAIAITLIAAASAVWWSARYTYFVASDSDDEILIYRGQPDGVLWLDPIIESNTGIELDRLVNESRRREISDGRQFGSVTEAEIYVTKLKQVPEATTSTTTTSIPKKAPTTSKAPTTTQIGGTGGNG